MDANSFFIEEQNKYEVEGPKNLFDQQMLVDWIAKIVKDHPLVTYIEDPVADNDI